MIIITCNIIITTTTITAKHRSHRLSGHHIRGRQCRDRRRRERLRRDRPCSLVLVAASGVWDAETRRLVNLVWRRRDAKTSAGSAGETRVVVGVCVGRGVLVRQAHVVGVVLVEERVVDQVDARHGVQVRVPPHLHRKERLLVVCCVNMNEV